MRLKSFGFELIVASRVAPEDTLARSVSSIFEHDVLCHARFERKVFISELIKGILFLIRLTFEHDDLGKLDVPFRKASGSVAVTALQPSDYRKPVTDKGRVISLDAALLIRG